VPTTSTPAWNAPQAGLVGDAAAIAGSAQINQMLGTHTSSEIYQGNAVLTPADYGVGAATGPWAAALTSEDVDQPFTMSGTTIGRVQIPIMPVGNGADLLVSLCADSAGTPGTMIAQTRIPANWINQLSPVAGTSTGIANSPTPNLTGNPLAVAQYRLAATSLLKQLPYPVPAVTGIAAASSTAWYDPYVIQVGGVNGGVALTNVFTIPYGPDGTLGKSIPQTLFPEPNDGSSSTIVAVDSQNGNPVVVNCGGGTSFGGAPVANVYTSNLNTATGALSAWSAQTALPYAVQNHTMATYNGYVYVIGGRLNSSTGYTNVTYAQVVNGQITAWTAATPLPQARAETLTAVSNGFLVVSVGEDAGITTTYETTWYAKINPNGSLGPWLAGPSLPFGDVNLNTNAFGNSQGIYAGGANNFSFLGMGPNGPSPQWIFSSGTLGKYPGYHDNGNGAVSVGALYNASNLVFNIYEYCYLSVPLPASGLTSGATYHVLMQQQGGDLNDYLTLMVNFTLPKSGLTSPRNGYTWTAMPNFGSSDLQGIPLSVFDNTVPYQGAMPWHSWEDGGAHVTTVVCATTPDQRLLGLCEATRTLLQRNQNSGFETGIPPWTVQNAAVAQSTAHVKEGVYAAQITPNGASAQCSITSEQTLPCQPGQAITVAGQFWFTAAVTSANFSLSVSWYTQAGAPISTSNVFTTMPTATYTPVVNTFTAPAGAYQYALVPTLQGTPAASQVWYADQVYSTDLVTPQQSTVTEVTYPGTWPGSTWPPLAFVELA